MYINNVEEYKRDIYEYRVDLDTVIAQCDKPIADTVTRIAELSAMVRLIDQLTGDKDTEYPVVECFKQLVLLCNRRFIGLGKDENFPLSCLLRHVKQEIDWEHENLDAAIEVVKKRLMLEPKDYSEADKEVARKLRAM